MLNSVGLMSLNNNKSSRGISFTPSNKNSVCAYGRSLADVHGAICTIPEIAHLFAGGLLPRHFLEVGGDEVGLFLAIDDVLLVRGDLVSHELLGAPHIVHERVHAHVASEGHVSQPVIAIDEQQCRLANDLKLFVLHLLQFQKARIFLLEVVAGKIARRVLEKKASKKWRSEIREERKAVSKCAKLM